jgi:hypothetical protein
MCMWSWMRTRPEIRTCHTDKCARKGSAQYPYPVAAAAGLAGGEVPQPTAGTDGGGQKRARRKWWGELTLGKFAFGDRTIPIHARTLGPDRYKPERDGRVLRYGTRLQWCTLTRPPLVRTHTSNPAFPTGGGLGGFVSFVVAVLNVVATPVEGGGPTLPLWGRVAT